MITAIKYIVLSLCNILPDSPFRSMIDSLELQQDYLQFINWFLPIDIVGNLMIAWLDCILAYFLFHLVSKYVRSLLAMIFKNS